MVLELSVCLVYVHTQPAGKSVARQTHTDDPWVFDTLCHSLYNKRGDILYHNLYNRSGVAQYTVSYTSIQGACLIGIGHRMSGLVYHIIFIFLNQVEAMSVVL